MSTPTPPADEPSTAVKDAPVLGRASLEVGGQTIELVAYVHPSYGAVCVELGGTSFLEGVEPGMYLVVDSDVPQ